MVMALNAVFNPLATVPVPVTCRACSQGHSECILNHPLRAFVPYQATNVPVNLPMRVLTSTSNHNPLGNRRLQNPASPKYSRQAARTDPVPWALDLCNATIQKRDGTAVKYMNLECCRLR